MMGVLWCEAFGIRLFEWSNKGFSDLDTAGYAWHLQHEVNYRLSPPYGEHLPSRPCSLRLRVAPQRNRPLSLVRGRRTFVLPFSLLSTAHLFEEHVSVGKFAVSDRMRAATGAS